MSGAAAPPRSRPGAALHAALALVGFLAVAFPLAEHVPAPERHDVRAKLEHLVRDPAAYDGVLFGTSRTYRSILPRIVERESGLRLFNFGIPGAEPWEVDHYLARSLDAARHAGAAWRVVVVEAWRQEPEDLGDQAFTRRRLAWHDAARTWKAVRACAREPEWDLARRAREASVHLHQFLWRATSYGAGPELARSVGLGGAEPERDDAWLERADGYRALEDDPHVRANLRRREFLADPDVVRRTAEDVRRELEASVSSGGEPLAGLDLALCAEQLAVVRALGAVPVLLVAPGSPRAVPPVLLEALGAPVLAYQSPDERPELWTPDARFDANHLTPAAAAAFSRTFAADLAEALRVAGERGRGH